MRSYTWLWLSPLVACSLVGCGAPAEEPSTELSDALHDAAHRYDVPYPVLAATAYALSRFDHRDGAENREQAVGLLNLHRDDTFPSLAAAAELVDVDPDELILDPREHVMAAAALMAEEARELEKLTGEPIDDYAEWFPIVAAWSGSTDPLIGEGFANQVYNWIEWGLAAETQDGEIVQILPTDLPWRDHLQPVGGSTLSAQFVPACASNYSNYSRGTSDVKYVVIHTMEGSYAGSISWFQNCSSGVSAHYSLRSSDGEITQSVDEQDVAWHAGDWDTNLKGIGIEHEGYVSDARWYTDAMYRASAALTRDICDRYGIPKDRAHVIGHHEVPGCSSPGGGGASCHTDPGSNWDWDYYMSLINETGAGSSSIGGTGATDGPRSGSFTAEVRSDRYSESDKCSGTVSGAVSGGQFYLTGVCTLDGHPEKVKEMPVVWSGSVSGDTIEGRMIADGRDADFAGRLHDDGTLSASVDGSEDLGGTAGSFTFHVEISAVP